MNKIKLHHLFIIHFLSIICVFCSTLSAFPPTLAGIKFKLDTDVDSLCHPSVAPSSFLSFSFSFSLPIARRTRAPADAFLSRATPDPPPPPPPSFTLSHPVQLSSSLSYSLLYTHSIVNKAPEQGTLGELRSTEEESNKRGPLHPSTRTLVSFQKYVFWGCFFLWSFYSEGWLFEFLFCDVKCSEFSQKCLCPI